MTSISIEASSGAIAPLEKIALETYVPLAKPSLVGLSRAEIAEFAFTSLYAASQRGENEGVTHIVRAELVIRQSTTAVRPAQ